MKSGVELISDERTRQIEVEGWTPEHDDEHKFGGLSKAAAVYALLGTDAETIEGDGSAWPWSPKWFKPSNERTRNLIKAGALIAAEIDRLGRIKNASLDQQTDGQQGGK